jgi:hypothetical protein
MTSHCYSARVRITLEVQSRQAAFAADKKLDLKSERSDVPMIENALDG